MASKTLPERYEIRKLGIEHQEWANAILIHSNMFHSPIWPIVYPEGLTARSMAAYKGAAYLVKHQLESGHSYGIFDKEHKFKTPEAEAAGGLLHWDLDDTTSDGPALLEQMDFPLVSIALAYDAINALDFGQMGDLMATLPMYGEIHGVLGPGDKRDPASWQAKAAGELILRNATNTRHDHEGRGLMGYLARWMMREFAGQGFRGIQIEAFSSAVDHVWANPPAPFTAERVSVVDLGRYQEPNEAGELVYKFAPATQVCTKIYCRLK